MKKWVLIFLSIAMMLILAVPALAEAGTAEAAQGAGHAAYTVEFTYDGRQYVMPGDSSVRLGEILEAVGLTDAVEAVEMSDPGLFSASDATGAWIVTAHRAFSSTEWMKVTIDGVVYEITVTDGIVLSGKGTAGDPYMIGTSEQWQLFSQLINTENATYGGKYYKLTADISIDANDNTFNVVGDLSGCAFRGHFDGGGYTLTFNYSGSMEGAAPFRYVNGATIENLKVAGTVKINAGKMFAAGIAGYVTGDTTISNCTSSVTISSIHSGSGCFGGLVGCVESWVKLNINNCVFNGSMTGSVSMSSGGFVGKNVGRISITDGLCAPESIDVNMYSFVQNWSDGDSTLTRVYRTYNSTNSSRNQGTWVYSSAPDSMLTKKITCADNAQYYAEGGAAITGISDSYGWTGTAIELPAYSVTFNGSVLTEGTDYTAIWKDSGANTVDRFTVEGTYTLTVTGQGSYAGSMTRMITVERVYGSWEYPYIISSEADWNDFAAAVNGGNSYSGKYVSLRTNISVSKMVGDGTESTKAFCGTFIGNNHTLTVNISGNYYTAPFSRVDGATIKDLTVAGAVHEASSYGGSLIGVSYGKTTISNCHSIAAFTFTGYRSGGFVGCNRGVLSMNDCSFKGSIRGTANEGSGFVGNNDPGYSVSIMNCLFAPTSAENGGCTLIGGGGTASWSAYYTTQYGTAQGTAVTVDLPNNSVCGKVIACDGQTYYRAGCTVTNMEPIYPLGDSVIHPMPTVKEGYMTLTRDTDYTLSWNEETAVEGNYTLTVTGAGAYAGTVTISYAVKSGTGTFGGQSFSKTSDDAGEYYIIATAEDLQKLAKAINAGYDRYVRFVQTADIDLSNVEFTAIGDNENNPFRCSYDGGHHVISGLSLDSSGSDLGLFGYISAPGTVRNVRLISPRVQCNNYGGTIAGQDVSGIIENCLVINPTVLNGGSHGAIIGKNVLGRVSNCYFYGGNQDKAIGINGINADHFETNVGRVYKVTLGDNLDVSTTYEGDGLDANGSRISNGDNKGYYCMAGSTVTLISAPGCTLKSASYKPEGGSETNITASGGVFSFTMPASDVSVTGKFDTLSYTVAFDENGGTGTMASMSFAGGEAKALTANSFTREGYTFTGWNTKSDGTGTSYKNQETVSLLTSTDKATITLYAQWTMIPATAPTITAFPQDLTLTEGYTTGGNLSVTATAASAHTLSYQWYSNNAPTTEDGTIINEAKAASYAVPTGLAEGNHYYYCVVTAERDGNKDTAAISVMATVTVNARIDAGVSINEGTELNVIYDEGYFTLTGSVTSPGTNGKWTWTSDNTDVAAVTSDGATTTVTIKAASETPVNITGSYVSDTTAGSATLALTVNKKSVTITGLGADNKPYDGNTTATVNGTASIDGVVGDDVVTVTQGAAAFDNKNVGTGKTVTFSGYTLSGAAAGNYTLSAQPASVTASITAKEVTVSGITAENKVYDGNTTATLVTTAATFEGKPDSDNLTVSATGTFENGNVGENKTVNISELTLGGASKDNYILATEGQQTTTTTTITAKEVGLTWSNTELIFNGEAQKPMATAIGLVEGDTCTVTVTGEQTNVGDSYTATASSLSNSNYKLPGNKTTIFKIKKANAVAATVTANNRIYDGKEKPLVTVTGETIGGELKFAVTPVNQEPDAGAYTFDTTSIPAKTDVGTYYVWYKVVADANHIDSAGGPIAVKIEEREKNTAEGEAVIEKNDLNSSIGLDELSQSSLTSQMDSVAESVANEDKTVTEKNEVKDVKLTLEAKVVASNSENTEQVAILNLVSEELSVEDATTVKSDFLELTVTKTVTVYKTEGTGQTVKGDPKSENVSDIGQAIDIPVKYNMVGKYNLVVSRKHGTKVTIFERLNSMPTNSSNYRDGTYYVEGSEADTIVHIFSSKFSTYGFTTYGDKENARITATPIGETLTSNGAAQELVTAGSADGGTMQYALGTDTTTVPTDGWTDDPTTIKRKNVGTYYVWYKVVGDADHNDAKPACVTATITRGSRPSGPSGPSGPSEPTTVTYIVTFKVLNGAWDDGTRDNQTVKLTGYDPLMLSPSQIPGVGTKPDEGYRAGSWDTVPGTTVTKNTAYTYTYEEKPVAVVTTKPEAHDLTENGEGQELVTAGEASGGTMMYAVGITDPADSWSESIPTATKAGSYFVWYKAAGDADHRDLEAVCIPVTIKYAPGSLVANGEDQELVNGGSVQGGTMKYALGSDDVTPPTGTWSETVPTGKDPGTYYVWYKVEGDENHNGVAPVCIKVTIVPDTQVQAFEEGLKTLPEDVTRDDEELVEALRKMYDDLSADQNSQIPEEDVKKLEAAEDTLESLKEADQGKADAVSALIDQLPEVDEVKLENKTAVDAVLKQYDVLTDEQKALLPAAEKEKIEALKAAFAGPSEEDQAVVAQFTEAVSAVSGNKAGEGKALVDNMTDMLSSMTDAQKALISDETMAFYNEAVDAFKPGRKFCSGNGYYKVLSNGDVTYHHPADETITSAVVPNRVKKGKFMFKVIKISNYAFDGCENLEWIVIHGNIRVIGEDAFNGTVSLTKINVKGSGIVSGKVDDAFKGAGKNGRLTVKVPKNKVNEYSELFTGEGGLDGNVKAA